MVFWKNRCLCIFKTCKYNSSSGWGFWECLWRVLFLVELQAYSLLPDWEMSPLGGIFRDFIWILEAFFLFFQKSCWVATTIAFIVVVAVVSFCLFCFVFFLFFFSFLPICFWRYSVVVVKIIKLYIVLLCLLMKKK